MTTQTTTQTVAFRIEEATDDGWKPIETITVSEGPWSVKRAVAKARLAKYQAGADKHWPLTDLRLVQVTTVETVTPLA